MAWIGTTTPAAPRLAGRRAYMMRAGATHFTAPGLGNRAPGCHRGAFYLFDLFPQEPPYCRGKPRRGPPLSADPGPLVATPDRAPVPVPLRGSVEMVCLGNFDTNAVAGVARASLQVFTLDRLL